MKKISVVIPTFNESGNIELMAKKLDRELHGYEREFIFVDDGSTDDTLNQIIRLSTNCDHIYYVSFSRNFGHQSALKAGIDIASGDCVISIDADLQQPVELIPKMIQQ